MTESDGNGGGRSGWTGAVSACGLLQIAGECFPRGGAERERSAVAFGGVAHHHGAAVAGRLDALAAVVTALAALAPAVADPGRGFPGR